VPLVLSTLAAHVSPSVGSTLHLGFPVALVPVVVVVLFHDHSIVRPKATRLYGEGFVFKDRENVMK
jgi:hypothetical protein